MLLSLRFRINLVKMVAQHFESLCLSDKSNKNIKAILNFAFDRYLKNISYKYFHPNWLIKMISLRSKILVLHTLIIISVFSYPI